jgi:hypothetical protein
MRDHQHLRDVTIPQHLLAQHAERRPAIGPGTLATMLCVGCILGGVSLDTGSES